MRFRRLRIGGILRVADQRCGRVQQVAFVVESAGGEPSSHLPADGDDIGGSGRRSAQRCQLALVQISQRPVRIGEGALGGEVVARTSPNAPAAGVCSTCRTVAASTAAEAGRRLCAASDSPASRSAS